MNRLLLILILNALSVTASSTETAYKMYDGDKIYYSAFNSSFISAGVAGAHDIVRSKHLGVINIAVVPANAAVGGRTALVRGTVSNLLQQSQKLNFFEVREGEVIYYLAQFKFDDGDSLTFNVRVFTDPNKNSYPLSFRKTFYRY